LSFAQLEALHGERFAIVEEVRFEPREAAVVARRVLSLGALVLKEQPLDAPDPARVAAALAEGIRLRSVEILPWNAAARQLQARVAFLRRDDPDGWPDLGDAALLATLDAWLGPDLLGRRRLSELADLDLHAILMRRLDHAQRHALDRLAPSRLLLPSGRRAAIDYTAEPPRLAVKLQELFGLAATPRIGGGRTALTIELLSPAGRPAAVTQDLAGFWATGYPLVRKELRGRYPKHPWPEDPLAAQPTAGTKRATASDG
jgi:ATP-dependent helicase HrpB